MPDAPTLPSHEEAVATLRRIQQGWNLDRSVTMALVRLPEGDFTTIEWTEDGLARVACLMELEQALSKLEPRGGVPRWISTAKPGPFFGDQSPLRMLMGPTRDMAVL